jgi:hypothetical protein
MASSMAGCKAVVAEHGLQSPAPPGSWLRHSLLPWRETSVCAPLGLHVVELRVGTPGASVC